ncbi:hypothetical protein N2152v2_010681 [Parachlorella kessleri]
MHRRDMPGYVAQLQDLWQEPGVEVFAHLTLRRNLLQQHNSTNQPPKDPLVVTGATATVFLGVAGVLVFLAFGFIVISWLCLKLRSRRRFLAAASRREQQEPPLPQRREDYLIPVIVVNPLQAVQGKGDVASPGRKNSLGLSPESPVVVVQPDFDVTLARQDSDWAQGSSSLSNGPGGVTNALWSGRRSTDR